MNLTVPRSPLQVLDNTSITLVKPKDVIDLQPTRNNTLYGGVYLCVSERECIYVSVGIDEITVRFVDTSLYEFSSL